MFRRHGIVALGWRLQTVSVISIAMISLSSGCSRIVSPPGQSAFAKPSQSLDQNQGAWNMAGQKPGRPSTRGSANSQQLGDGVAANPNIFSEKDRLDHQYAQSAKLLRSEPPRLIPIEPMDFPGTPEVVAPSSSNAIAMTGNGKMIVLSDASIAPQPTDQGQAGKKNGTVQQAGLAQDEINKTQAESVMPATLIAAPKTDNKVALASSIENVDQKQKSYHQPGRSGNESDSIGFNPDAFAADRRAIPAAKKLDTPPGSENKFSDSFGTIKMVKSVSAASNSESTPAVSASSVSVVPATPDPKQAMPTQAPKTSSDAPANQNKPRPAETNSPPAFGQDALLDAAGIKVDKGAFDFTPAKKMPLESPSKSEGSNSPNSKPREAGTTAENSQSEFMATPMKAVPEATAIKPSEPKPFKDSAMATLNANSLTANPLPEKLTGHSAPSPATNKTVCDTEKAVNCISPEELGKATWVKLPEATVPSEKVEKASATSDGPANGTCETNKTCEAEKSSAVPAPLKSNADFLPINPPTSRSSNPAKSNLEKPIPMSSVPSVGIPASFVAMEKVDELKIANPCFCTEIKGFGQVTRFPTSNFKGNQKTLIYCEVENYSSKEEQGANGATNFVTRLKGRYEIFDSKNQSIQSGQFPDIEDITNRKRRDFYLYFPVAFKDLPPGDYELKVLVEEKESSAGSAVRTATNSLRFAVGK